MREVLFIMLPPLFSIGVGAEQIDPPSSWGRLPDEPNLNRMPTILCK